MSRLASRCEISRTALPTAAPLAITSFSGRLSLMRSMHPAAVARCDKACSNMICTRRVGLASATSPWLRTVRYRAAAFCEYIMAAASGTRRAAAQTGARTARAPRRGVRVELCGEIGLCLFERCNRRVHGVVLSGQRGRIVGELLSQLLLLYRNIAQARL